MLKIILFKILTDCFFAGSFMSFAVFWMGWKML